MGVSVSAYCPDLSVALFAPGFIPGSWLAWKVASYKQESKNTELQNRGQNPYIANHGEPAVKNAAADISEATHDFM
jgi:hypothetical protein